MTPDLTPAKVATAGGIYDVIPAGEFQPSSVALWDRRNDFDLWRNVVREYAEELLGEPEHDGTRSQFIDYDDWPLYSLWRCMLREFAEELLGESEDHGSESATIDYASWPLAPRR